MPTLFYAFGMRFFFYSNEHVRNADGEAKFSVKALRCIDNKGLKNKDVKLARALIKENKELIINAWHTHFSK